MIIIDYISVPLDNEALFQGVHAGGTGLQDTLVGQLAVISMR